MFSLSAPRRSCAPSLLLVMASLLLAAPNAHAGTYDWTGKDPNTGKPIYSPIYSGGTLTDFSVTTGSHNSGSPYNLDTRPSPPTYDGIGGDLCYPGANGNATTFTASGSGSLSAKFTWQPAYVGELPPTAVIIQQNSSVTMGWSDSSGATLTGPDSTGLGQSSTISGSSGNVTIAGTSYSGAAPAGDGSVSAPSCSPSVSQNGNSGTAGGAQANFTITYSATASPVTINLGGAIKDSSGNYNILVGQGCTASLSGIPSGTGWRTTYSWSVSGTTFQDWEPTTPGNQSANPPIPANSQASYYDPGPGVQTNSTYHWYWNDSSQQTETVTCTATVTPPAGQGSSFPITVTQKVSVYVPTRSTNMNTVGDGRVLNSTIIAHQTPGMMNNLENFGSSWTTSISTPTTPAFGTGQWCYCQLITPGEYLTDVTQTLWLRCVDVIPIR